MSARGTQSEARGVARYPEVYILASLIHMIPALAMVYCGQKRTLLVAHRFKTPGVASKKSLE